MEEFDSEPEKFASLFQDEEMYKEMRTVLATYTYKFFRNVAENV